MAGFKKHIFICENKRDPETGRISCGLQDSSRFKAYLKKRLKEKGLHKRYRINSAGCLGHCEHGPTMVIYPAGIWYGHVRESDLDEILEKSILDDQIITRLQIGKEVKHEKTALS